MANTQVPVYQPTVTAQVGADNGPVDTATVMLTAGGLSMVNLTLQKRALANGESGAAVNALTEDVPTDLETLQSLVFAEGKTSPDSYISIADGQKGDSHVLTVKGYLSNPSYSNMPGAMGPNYTFLHESVILGNYRSHLYNSPEVLREVTPGTSVFTPANALTDAPARLLAVLNILIEKWTTFFQESNPTYENVLSLAEKAAWHTQNGLVFQMLVDVITASKGNVDWPAFANLDADSQNVISEYMATLLSEKYENFFGVIQAFERSFQCMFVPSFDTTNVGQFISYSAIARGAGTKLILPIVAVQFSGGDRLALPITHVLIQGCLPQTWRAAPSGQGQGNIPDPFLAAWPPTAYTGGRVLIDSGPPWIYDTTGGVGQTDPSTVFSAINGLDLTKYQAGRTTINQFIATVTGFKGTILQTWASNLYAFTALQKSTCTIPIPLDVSIKPGKRYLICNETGTEFFTGFLAQVSHRVVSSSKSPDATTTLSFTHLTAGDFVLPES